MAKTSQEKMKGKSMITVVNPIYDCVFKFLMEDERIAKTLLAATVTAEVRAEMLVEDEFFSAIENRDTELMEQKRLLAENKRQLAQKDDELSKKDDEIAKKDDEIAEKEQKILNMAILMINSGIEVSDIMQATGLSKEQIIKLKDKA